MDLNQKNSLNNANTAKGKKRKKTSRFNRWSVFGMLFLGAVFIVIYVNNVIKIDSLLMEIQNLKKKQAEIKYKNQALSANLNELQSPEEIIKRASERLKMIKPEEAPEVIK